ncbi:hypothetical protein SAMN04487881_0826 [Marinobacter sp. es.048]|nr:hypothetical protein SAMN04487881_0826 [Marinobacter sp. es.048]
MAGSDAGTTEWLKDLATRLLPNAQGCADLFRERVTAWLPFIFYFLLFSLQIRYWLFSAK